MQEIAEILAQGLTNADIEDEHSAARANLIESLPGPCTRTSVSTQHRSCPFRAFSRYRDWNNPTSH